jgi:hypothetical protein
MFAVHTLVDIGRTDEAKVYLKKLLAAKPDRKTLAELHREHHSYFFFQLSRDHRLRPEGEQLGKAVLDAAYEAAHDPARLRQLVKQLSAPLPGPRQQALEELNAVGTASVPPLLEALADPQRASEYPALRHALPRLGADALTALTAVLESPDDALRQQVIGVLGQAKSAVAVPYLVGLCARTATPAPTRDAAAQALEQMCGKRPTTEEMARYLYRRAQEHYDGAVPAPLDYDDKLTLWHWDAKDKRPVPRRYPAAEAAMITAARLAADLYQLQPGNSDYRRLFLTTDLEAAKIEQGLGRRLPREGTAYKAAAAAGVAALEDVLQYASEHGRPLAATGAVEILGDIGTVALLHSVDGRPRPLVLALRHGDRRLRFAAAEAICKLDPQQPYAGSSQLAETLGYLIRTVGSRRALVAHPRVDQSQSLVGMLSQLGLDGDAARTGSEAFRMATSHADHEFLLLSDGIDRPDMNETIQLLRRDPRTRRLPIGLMARAENVRRCEELARLHPLVASFPRPHDVPTLAFLAGRLRDLAGRELVPYDERLDQAVAAMDHLLRLADAPRRYGFYDLYRQLDAAQAAMFTPPLSAKAAHLVGLLGSPEAQRALVNLASQQARPLEQRQAAVKGLLVAVQRHGLLLTRDEILRQYDRYNRSQSLDADTQHVLSAVLDAIELPSKRAQSSGAGPGATDKPRTPPRGGTGDKTPEKAPPKA